MNSMKSSNNRDSERNQHSSSSFTTGRSRGSKKRNGFTFSFGININISRVKLKLCHAQHVPCLDDIIIGSLFTQHNNAAHQRSHEFYSLENDKGSLGET